MPRPETPIDVVGPVAELASGLRQLRASAGLSYRDMARISEYSAAALSTAASGRIAPTWPAVEAYVRACGGDPHQWREAWESARREGERTPAGAGSDGPGAPAMVKTRFAPSLIGRQRHLDRTREWVTALATGRGRAVLVEGEPGIGKSSLVRAAADEAKTAGCQVFWASCDELSHAFPLLPLLDALESAPVGGGPAEIAELLRATSSPGGGVDEVAAAAERLLSLIDEVCASAPALLVVDDLQWADPATMQTLGRLIRNVHQLPLLVAGVMRPVPIREDLKALSRSVRPADRLRLHSLSEAEVARVVENAAGGRPGPRLLRLAAGAAGNPLYVTELVDALARGGALTVEHGIVEATGTRTPSSLAAAIADRIEFLSAPSRGLLRAAALLGVDFSVSELAILSGQTVSDLMPVLDEAIVAGVLRESDIGLTFRHPLIRAALYEEMPAMVRAAWHGDAARALATGGAPAERVARQLLPAFQGNAAVADDWMVAWLVTTAQELVNRAPSAAVPLLRQAVAATAVDLAPHGFLSCRLADALYRTGDLPAAAEVATQALESVTEPEHLVDLHWTLAQCRAMDGRAEEALVALDRALDGPAVDPAYRTRLLALKARTQVILGRVDDAQQVADAAVTAATAAGDAWATAWGLSVLAVARAMAGADAEILPLLDRALTITDSRPDLTDLGLALRINRAAHLATLDRYADAIHTAELARRLADDIGNVVRLSQAQSLISELLFLTGRWDDALAEIESITGATDPATLCTSHAVAASILLHRGDAAASRHLRQAERAAAQRKDIVNAHLVLARSVDRDCAGAPAEALDALTDQLADATPDLAVHLAADAARLAGEMGDESALRRVMEQVEFAAGPAPSAHWRAVVQHVRGTLDSNPDLLLAAANAYEAVGRPLPQAQAVEAAATLRAQHGDIAAARTHFTSAYALYVRLGAEWDLARTQATFREYGIRRGPRASHRRTDGGWSSLTPTELKVAQLVAEGMSNPQIAAHLFLSRRTVQTHVSHILAKLMLHSRTEIAREVARTRDVGQAGTA